ncbi:MAG: hypothetical protein AAF487_03400 [Bacteroidota bacterium]
MKFYFLIVLSILVNLGLKAQETSFSPYSRFGIGELSGDVFNRQYSMGGTGIAVMDYLGVNPLNPASYSYISEPAFEMGIHSRWMDIESQTEAISGNITRVNHVALGMPIRKKNMGFSFGLVPLSNIGYDISKSDSINDFSISQQNVGEGGINALFLGFGKRIDLKADTVYFNKKDKTFYNNSLSFGFNFNYLFGNRTNITRSIFPNGVGAINTQVTNIDNTSDVAWKLGFLYSTWIKKKRKAEDSQIRFNIGLSLSPETQLKSTRSQIVESYIASSTIQLAVDSVLSNEDNEGFVRLPQELGIGVAFEFFNAGNDKIILAGDYRTRAWSKFEEDFGTPVSFDELVDANRLSVGIEYIPRWKNSIKGTIIPKNEFFQSIYYRAGVFRNSGYLLIENHEFTESGINFGLGLPFLKGGLKESSTEFNIGFELSRRGSIDNNLLKENNLELFVGVRFNPNIRSPWFIKRKYD